MAEEVQETAEAEEVAKGGKRKLVLLATGLILALLAGGGGAAYVFGVFDSDAEAAAVDGGHPDAGDDAHADGHGEAEHGAAPAQIVFIEMPDVLVNLKTDSPRMRFLKLKVALEVEGEETAEAIRQLTPRIMDSFQMYLRALTTEEVEGAEGLQELKEALSKRINYAIEPNRVADVLIKEMLVQ